MKSLLRRIEKLEARVVQPKVHIRLGDITERLPEDFKGERHLVVTKRYCEHEQNWVEYAESAEPEDRVPGDSYVNVIFV